MSRQRHETAAVEFIAEPVSASSGHGGAPDGTAPDGSGSPGHPPRRPGRRVLMIAVLAAVALGGAAWALTRSNEGGPDVARANLRPTVTRTVPSPTPTGAQALTCPTVTSCTVLDTVPSQLRAAVLERFPDARDLVVSSVQRLNATAGAVIYERLVSTAVGPDQLILRLRANLPSAERSSPTALDRPVGDTVTLFRLETLSYIVDVQWNAPTGSALPGDQLEALADDPRLFTTG